MSLARSFTKRMKRFEEDITFRGRSNTVRHNTAPVIDAIKISSPIELLSTTNVHALNAPDIRKASDTASSADSTHSGNDSEFSTIDRSFLSSTGDNDSVPGTPITPPQETTKDFFDTIKPVPEAPRVPQRSPSHSKKAHVELSRKMSVQRNSPPPMSLARTASVRDSNTMFSSKVQEEATLQSSQPHPFGAELSKVNEVAEDFGSPGMILDEEEQIMQRKGLQKFSVQDYLDELVGLHGGVFEDRLGSIANPWV